MIDIFFPYRSVGARRALPSHAVRTDFDFFNSEFYPNQEGIS